MLEPHQKLFIQDLPPHFRWEVRQHKKKKTQAVRAKLQHVAFIHPTAWQGDPRDHDKRDLKHGLQLISSTTLRCNSSHFQMLKRCQKSHLQVPEPSCAWAQVVLPEVALETGVAAQSTILHTGASRIPWAVSFQKDLTCRRPTDVDPNGGM